MKRFKLTLTQETLRNLTRKNQTQLGELTPEILTLMATCICPPPPAG